jgi:hypothetical protein
MKCPKCGCKTLANENTQGVWSCGTKSWSYCSDVIESPQCLRNQLKQRTAERDELRFENAKLKAELTLIEVWKRELSQRTAKRDELLAENHQLKGEPRRVRDGVGCVAVRHLAWWPRYLAVFGLRRDGCVSAGWTALLRSVCEEIGGVNNDPQPTFPAHRSQHRPPGATD